MYKCFSLRTMQNETRGGPSRQSPGVPCRRIRYQDPEALERHLAAVVPGVRIRPGEGDSLTGSLRLAGSSRVSMLSFSGQPMHAVIPPSHQMYGVTVSQSGEYLIREGKRARLFDIDAAHFLVPGEVFDFRSVGRRPRVFGTNFFLDIFDYAQRAGAEVVPSLPSGGRLHLRSHAGEAFRRCLAFAWGEAAASGGLWSSPLAARELEDTLCAALLWMLTSDESAERRAGVGDARLDQLEDYIDANLTEPMTRETLANVVGVSLRTINRDFKARHGVGVMAFVRRKRLEAVRRALLDAELGSTRVQDVALHFGITELGRFSAAYRQAFGELPSRTLSRRRRSG